MWLLKWERGSVPGANICAVLVAGTAAEGQALDLLLPFLPSSRRAFIIWKAAYNKLRGVGVTINKEKPNQYPLFESDTVSIASVFLPL